MRMHQGCRQASRMQAGIKDAGRGEPVLPNPLLSSAASCCLFPHLLFSYVSTSHHPACANTLLVGWYPTFCICSIPYLSCPYPTPRPWSCFYPATPSHPRTRLLSPNLLFTPPLPGLCRTLLLRRQLFKHHSFDVG